MTLLPFSTPPTSTMPYLFINSQIQGHLVKEALRLGATRHSLMYFAFQTLSWTTDPVRPGPHPGFTASLVFVACRAAHLINKTNDQVISILQCVYISPHPSVPSTLLICYQVTLPTASHRTARKADNDLAQSRRRSFLLPPESSPPLWFLSPSHS